jgi:Zn-dependent protease with chaperone function
MRSLLMQTKRPPFWMLLVGLVVCSTAVLIESGSHECGGSLWICSQQQMAHDVWMMVLPLGWLLLRGCFAGLRQLRRTRQLVRIMLSLPPHPLSTQMAEIVARLNLEGRVSVVEYATPEAFCYGLFRPRICLTAPLLQLLSSAEIEAVLRHERHHLHRYDPLRTIIWTILSNTFWWLDDHAHHAYLLRELAADQAVIAAQGRTPLARALFKLLAVPNAHQLSRPELAVSGISVTDARIDQLIHPEQVVAPPLRIWQWLYIPVMLLLTLIACSVVMAHL